MISKEVKTPVGYTTLDIIPTAENKNLLPLDKITIGASAEAKLRESINEDSITDTQVSQFRKNAQSFIIKVISKMCERNPVNYTLVRNANCLDPQKIKSATPSSLRQKMKNVTTLLVQSKIIQPSEADEALKQYTELIQQKELLPAFNRCNDRVDSYFFKNLRIGDNKKDLAEVAKAIFTLSHGQADVERGFSINKTAIKVNQSEMSLISKRLIKDYMTCNNYEPHTVPKKTELIQSVNQSHKRYRDHLEQEKRKKNLEAIDIAKAQLSKDIKDVEQQIKEKQDTAKSLQDKAWKKIRKQKPKKTCHMSLKLTASNVMLKNL